MTCRELERLWETGASPDATLAHQRTCASCARVGEAFAVVESLAPATWSPGLRQSLLAIPRQTVSCEGAEPLIAAAMEGEGALSETDGARLQSHLSRCGACTEAAESLFQMRELTAPQPPPWLATRLSAVRPEKKRSPWRMLLTGKAVVVYAYAAACLVMLLGLNPTALPNKAGFARLSESTRSVMTVAQNSIGDRLGAFQEKAFRTVAVWRGHLGGYGRAAVSNAIAIVWRPEPKKTPSRPRLGKEGTASGLNESWIAMRAELPSPAVEGGMELFAARFRV